MIICICHQVTTQPDILQKKTEKENTRDNKSKALSIKKDEGNWRFQRQVWILCSIFYYLRITLKFCLLFTMILILWNIIYSILKDLTSEIKEGAAVDLEPSQCSTDEIPTQLQPPTSSAHIVNNAQSDFLFFDLETTGLGNTFICTLYLLTIDNTIMVL